MEYVVFVVMFALGVVFGQAYEAALNAARAARPGATRYQATLEGGPFDGQQIHAEEALMRALVKVDGEGRNSIYRRAADGERRFVYEQPEQERRAGRGEW